MELYQQLSSGNAVIVHEETAEILYEIQGDNALEVAKLATEDQRWGTPYQSDAVLKYLKIGCAQVVYSLYPLHFIPDTYKAPGYICQLDLEAEKGLSPQVRFAS